MIKKKNKFRYFSVNTKIFVSYVPILLVLICIGFGVFRSVLQINAMKKICISRVSELQQISDKMEYIHQNTINISNVYLFNETIQNFLNYPDTETQFEQSRRYTRARTTLTEQHSIFYNIPFYTTIYGFREEAYVTNSPYGNRETDKKRVSEYQKMIEGQYSQLYWADVKNAKGDIVLTAARYIFDPSNGETLGMIFFDFAESLFSQTFQKSLQNNETISLIWENGQIISSSDPDRAEKVFAGKDLLDKMEGYSSGYFHDTEQEELVCFAKYAGWDLYIVKTEPYQEVISTLSEPDLYLAVLIVTVIVVFTLVTILLSHYISQPLKALTREVGRFHNRTEKPNSRRLMVKGDEIFYLREEYYKLQQRIDSLIEQTIKEQESKREYEMKALQNQINPHFLYNTLLSLRFLNRIGERQKLDQTILALVRLLSNLFEKEASSHTIREELELLQDYILIQQTRYGNNFDVEYHCTEEVLDCKIEKLILQPLVENAIFHGISSYEDGGQIKISICRQDTQVKIKIWDNGVGLENSCQPSEHTVQIKHGIGLDNVKKRLYLMYGEKYHLDLFTPTEGGTAALLEIPYQKEEKEEPYAKGDDC